ncbi:MAG: lipocalin-like domain-containing protein [Rubrivivax sp.]
MLLRRRALLAGAPAWALLGARTPTSHAGAGDDPESRVQRGRVLRFPRDHGAHPGAGIEWWYVTGWLGPSLDAPVAGFQVTFFRRRTGLAADSTSRFAARQLLFAHAALSDLRQRRHRHAERIARWSETPDAPLAHADVGDTGIVLGRWSLQRSDGGGLRAQVIDAELRLELELQPTQPVLLQGDAGFSRKGPLERQASHYLSEPQLAVRARIAADGPWLSGRGWLDHEWSDELLAPDAVGWDWIGINLADGAALTAFRLRRADGSVSWAGGSWRAAGGAVRTFAPDELHLEPDRSNIWTSGRTGARYPVRWQVTTPVGRFVLQALLDDQELDGRAGTGTVYWEGLSELRDAGATRRLGLGYLEMTGYAGRLRL